jgi:hypothetical protein
VQLNCSKGGPRTCSFDAISLHSLLTESEFSSCQVTLQIDMSLEWGRIRSQTDRAWTKALHVMSTHASKDLMSTVRPVQLLHLGLRTWVSRPWYLALRTWVSRPPSYGCRPVLGPVSYLFPITFLCVQWSQTHARTQPRHFSLRPPSLFSVSSGHRRTHAQTSDFIYKTSGYPWRLDTICPCLPFFFSFTWMVLKLPYIHKP